MLSISVCSGCRGETPCQRIQGGSAPLASLESGANGAKVACHFAKLAYHHYRLAYHHYRLVDPFAVFGGRGDSGLALQGHGAASFRKNDMTEGHGIFCGMAERNVSAKCGMKDG